MGDHDQPARAGLHDHARGLNGWAISHSLSPGEVEIVYGWLSEESYWAKGLPRAVFDKAIANSWLFAMRDEEGRLCGFARLITDKATFAYLCDVFVSADVRGQGAGQFLIRFIIDHPDLQNLRRTVLATRDAHEFYARFGFTSLTNPQIFMQRHDPDVYARLNAVS
ncbi:GNAT family N-acetyltransferase [Microvirga flavescens]|uniref:GNAT family N-acetyltransferase n=1 Tax=Microvirga flavescens TaxID=2249811 RepID=UPI0018E09E57|nr:GNAT family N-acetyltransferase [Microvirga flavescens]